MPSPASSNHAWLAAELLAMMAPPAPAPVPVPVPAAASPVKVEPSAPTSYRRA